MEGGTSVVEAAGFGVALTIAGHGSGQKVPQRSASVGSTIHLG
jgi:hypothetical protein